MLRWNSILLLLLTSLSLQAEIYKWKGSDGRVYFSDHKPSEIAEEVALKPSISEERLEQAQKKSKDFVYRQQRKNAFQKEEGEKVRNLEKEKEHKLAKQKNYCSKAKRELMVLKTDVAVYRTNKAGERVYVGDAQRESEIKEWNHNIRKYCK
jgi:tRNA G10  N-methylase Trm11